MNFKRKVYSRLLEWKEKYSDKYAVLLEGARRVGKSTIAQSFGENEYDSCILIDFSKATANILECFDDIANLNIFFLRLQAETGITLYEHKSLIIFDEVQLFPKARQAIKHLVADGRYSYLETGSLISIKKNVKDILIPSEEMKIQVYPMDYQEFCDATGGNYELLCQIYNTGKAIGQPTNRKLMRDLRIYMAVGGMPQAVEAYMKAITLDPAKTDLWREVSSSYELNNEFTKAIEAYKKYSESLSADKRTPDVQFQIGKLYYEKGTQSDTLTVSLDERKAALVSADSIFTEIAKVAPDSYLGNFWRARTNSALDPETTQGLAKPYYEEVAAFLIDKNDPRYNSALIECYSYLGYYYLVANKLPESKEYWNKILAIDPANATAKRALDGIK